MKFNVLGKTITHTHTHTHTLSERVKISVPAKQSSQSVTDYLYLEAMTNNSDIFRPQNKPVTMCRDLPAATKQMM